MIILPLIVNGLVIAVIGAELIAIALGAVSADELLVVSSISALLTLASFKLSKDALQVSSTGQASTNEGAEEGD